MKRRHSHQPFRTNGSSEVAGILQVLPSLATAEQIAKVLQITSRAVHQWTAAGIIPVAFRQGRVVRFSPPAIARALGIDPPEFRSFETASSILTILADDAPSQGSPFQGS